MQKKLLILANEHYPRVCVGGLGKFVAGINGGLRKFGWQTKVFLPSAAEKTLYFPFLTLEAATFKCSSNYVDRVYHDVVIFASYIDLAIHAFLSLVGAEPPYYRTLSLGLTWSRARPDKKFQGGF